MKREKVLKIFNRLLIVFFLFWLVFLTNTEALSWNDKSRFATIQNIVEKNSFVINNAFYEKATGDKVMINGLFYSDKPPLLSVIASAPYLLLHKVGIYFTYSPKLVVFLTILLLMVIPFLILSYIIYCYTKKYTELEKEKAILLTTSLCIGTSLFAFSATLNNHQSAAIPIAIALLYIFFKKQYSLLSTFFISFAFSIATFIDLGVIFIAIPFSVFVLIQLIKQSKEKKELIQKILLFVIGALIPLIIHYCINKSITGDIWPASMHPEFFNYPNSPFLNQDLLTGTKSTIGSISQWLKYVWHLSFGKRGFLLHDPVILVGLLIAFFYSIKQKGEKQLFAIFTLISFFSLFVYYSLFGKNAGGVSYSVRWFVISIPIFIPLLIEWTAKQKKKLFALIIFLCLALSIIQVSATGNVISSTNRFKDRHSFINTTDNFPNYFWSQYSTWKKFIINIVK